MSKAPDWSISTSDEDSGTKKRQLRKKCTCILSASEALAFARANVDKTAVGNSTGGGHGGWTRVGKKGQLGIRHKLELW